MLKALVYILFIAGSCVQSALAQESYLSGAVADKSGKRVPFVSVYINGTLHNTIANELGEYKIRLPKGEYEVRFRYVGYSEQTLPVIMAGENKVLNVQLDPEYFLYAAGISSTHREDLANSIVRKVMANRRVFLKESSYFSCDVYTKGVQKLIKAPQRIFGQDVSETLSLDSNKQTILYQSETVSKLYIRNDDKKETMLASKMAGDNQGFTFNRALDLQVNFYNNLIHWNSVSKNSFVSPVADNAFQFYRYDFIGSFEKDGHRIYKVKVTPKNRFDPAFNGFIYVVHGEWRLYSVDLRLLEEARIDFVDSLRVSQQFVQLKEKVWQPSDITFRFRGKVLGFEFAGNLVGVYRNYDLDPKLPENFFSDEIVKINADAEKKDLRFWEEKRPIPLTGPESLSYLVKDSLEARKQSREYLDSVQRERNKFNPVKFAISGYTLENLHNKSSWYFYPLHNSVFYNTVEGWGVNLKAQYTKQYSYKRYLDIIPNFRYGFASKTFNANAEVTYRYDTLNHASVTFKGGSDFLDLNNRGSINLFYNTLSTLFDGNNYLKLYRSHFASLRTNREIIDGLQISAGFEIARRFPVRNSSYQNIFEDARKNLTSNNPLAPNVEMDLFPVNNAFVIEGKASYTYGQKFTTRPDGKVYEDPKYPTIQLNYRKGIKNVFGSAVDYDFVSLDVFRDKMRVGLLGYSSFYVSAGKFLNTNSIYFPDLRHFTGNQTAVYNPLFPNFHFLDYYAFSTNDKYFESHYEHNFSGLLLSKVPLIRKLKLEEIIGGAYLGQPQRNYKEVYFGFQRLVFRIDYGFSWTTGARAHQAVRIFYGF